MKYYTELVRGEHNPGNLENCLLDGFVCLTVDIASSSMGLSWLPMFCLGLANWSNSEAVSVNL